MKRDCTPFWQGIVELAEGRDNPGAKAHVESCGECQALLQQVKRMLEAAAIPTLKAPVDLVTAAKAFMPGPQPLRVLRTSLQLAGARWMNQDFQVVYEAREFELRVSYTKTEGGWEVVGKVPSDEWSVNKKRRSIPIQADGRFFFTVKSLEQSGFVLMTSNEAFTVPSGSEAMDESTRDS